MTEYGGSENLTFTKTSAGQFEAMTPQTHITRGNSRPLYNSVYESGPTGNNNPTNTEWAYGNIDNWNTLTYTGLWNLHGNNPPSMVNVPMVLHLKSENIYMQITFTYWEVNGGGFTYTRTTKTGCFTKSTTNASVCQGNSYAFNGVTYATAGIFTKILTNAAGCDSTAKLNLTILPIPNTTIIGSTTGCPNVQLQAKSNVPGIKFEYYENYTQTFLSNFNTLIPTTTGYTNKCDIDARSRTGDNFAFRYTGKINIPTAGNYTFYTTSDDGSNLKIDGNIVVNNDFLQPSTERSGSVTLTAGMHDIEVAFFEHSGGEVLQAHFQGPGISKVELSGNNYLVSEGVSNYLWSTGATPNASLNTISSIGNHTLTTTFSNGCSSINNFTVTTGLPAITGASSVCVGSSIALSNAQAGGVWSSIAGRATVNASGIVIGTIGGTATIKYALSGCGSVTKTVTINALPATPSIAYALGTVNPLVGAGGGLNFCKGRVFTVVGSPSGGTWNYTNPTVASITQSGVVTLIGNGSGAIQYTYTNSNGCSNSRSISGNVVTCAARGVNNGQLTMDNGQFTMYPNPAKSFISLSVNTLIGAGSIVVTDLYGKQVRTQALSMGNNTMDIATLAKGMYMVSVITKEGKTTQKLVVE